jgi:hypothetical protein
MEGALKEQAVSPLDLSNTYGIERPNTPKINELVIGSNAIN